MRHQIYMQVDYLLQRMDVLYNFGGDGRNDGKRDGAGWREAPVNAKRQKRS